MKKDRTIECRYEEKCRSFPTKCSRCGNNQFTDYFCSEWWDKHKVKVFLLVLVVSGILVLLVGL